MILTYNIPLETISFEWSVDEQEQITADLWAKIKSQFQDMVAWVKEQKAVTTQTEALKFGARNPTVDETIRQDQRVTKAMRDYQKEHHQCEWPNCKETDVQVHHSQRPLWMEIAKTREEQILSAADATQYISLCEPHHLVAHNGCFAERIITNLRDMWKNMNIVSREKA